MNILKVVSKMSKSNSNITLLTLIFCVGFSFAQNNIQLTLVERSDRPNTDKEHIYTVEVNNTSSSQQKIALSATNVNCDNVKAASIKNDMEVSLLDMSKGSLQTLILSPGQSKKIYIKLNRTANAKLNTWSCIEINAGGIDSKNSNSSLLIKQFIPDPKSFE